MKMKQEKRYTIVSTDIEQYADEDAREELLINNVEESEITETMIYDEKCNMVNVDIDNFWWELRRIPQDEQVYYIEAELGLWNGIRKAHGIEASLESAIRRCLAGMDDYKIEETAHGKLVITGYHHDGTNYYEIYKGTAKSNKRNIHLRRLLGWIN